MYKFEGDKIADGKTNCYKSNKKIEISASILGLITVRAIELDSLDLALKQLLSERKIDNRVSVGTYKKKLSKHRSYIKWRKLKNADKKREEQVVKALNRDGLNYYEISKKVNISYQSVWNIINRNRRKKKTDDEGKVKTQQNKYQSIVDYWNRTHFEGKQPTLSTIEAFKFLGLEPPKFNY
jgi:Mor family transcriptional regulator